MTTLMDYVQQHYPNHLVEVDNGAHPLTAHTAVAHVTGRRDTQGLENELRERMPEVDLGVVIVRPASATVVPSGREDPDGISDLPARRVASAAMVGGALIGAACGVVVALIGASAILALIVGAFGAVIGGWIGGMVGGGGRYAGRRAWTQSRAPDHSVGVIAAFVETEGQAKAVAEVMDRHEPEQVRILDESGLWHVPNT